MVAAVTNKIKNAYNVPFLMEEKQNEILNKYFSPRLVIATNELVSSHPISSAALYIANVEADKYRKHPDVTEIGGDLKKYLSGKNNAHLCLKQQTDERDESRLTDYYIQAQRNISNKRNTQPIAKQFVDTLYTNRECVGGSLCMNGIQNCNKKCNEIISVFSIFDIPLSTIHEVFKRTGAIRLTAWGYFPPELQYPGMQNIHEEYTLTYFDKDLVPTTEPSRIQYVSFNFSCDSSHGYVHNYLTWKSYIEQTHYPGEGFNLSLEKVQTNGPFQTIVIRKTFSPGITTYRISNPYPHLICVPDAIDVLRTGEIDFSKIFITDRNHAIAIINYAVSLTPNSFNHNTIMTYARSRQMALKIGVINVRGYWEDKNPLDELITRLIIIAMLRRTIQSKQLSEASNKIKNSTKYWNEHVEFDVDDSFDQSKAKLISYFFGYLSQTDRILSKLTLATIDSILYMNYGAHIASHEDIKMRSVLNADAANLLHSKLIKIDLFEIPSKIVTVKREKTNIPALNWVLTDETVDDFKPEPEIKKITYQVDELLKEYCKTLGDENHEKQIREKFFGDTVTLNVPNFTDFEIEYCFGLAGTGKSHKYSTQVLSADEQKSTCVITPLNAIRNDWKYHTNVFTQHQALLVNNKFDTVIIDECFMLHPGHILLLMFNFNAKKLILIGDPFQIEFIDFTGTVKEPIQLSQIVSQLNPQIRLLTNSRRFSDDYAKKLNLKFKIGITGNDKSTTYTYHTSTKNYIHDSGKTLLCFTQESKRMFLHNNPMTIHESQGKTFNRVDIVVTKFDKSIVRSARHWYVALTRAKISVDVWDDLICQEFDLSNSIENNLNIFGFTPYTQHIIKKEQMTKIQSECFNYQKIDDCKGVDDILAKIAVPQSEILSTFCVQYPSTDSLKLKELKPEIENEKKICFKGSRFSHDTYHRNSSMALATLLGRYAKTTQNLNEELKIKEATSLVQSFIEKYFRSEDNIYVVDLEELNECEYDMYLKLLLKNNENKVSSEIDLVQTYAIDFFLKQQQKAKTKSREKYDKPSLTGMFAGKYGQGVSAWTKTMNVIISPWIRALEKALRRNLRDNVILANGMEELKMLSSINFLDLTSLSIIEGDIEEFDCNQNETTVLAECMLYQILGAPAEFILLYAAFRKKWRLKSIDLGTLDGRDKQHSGQPSTLLGNSIVTLLLCSRVVDNIENSIVLAKGDDSLIIGKDIKFNDYLSIQDNTLNLKIKSIENKPPQFVNYFVTQDGLVPDPIRLTAKVKSKIFPDKPSNYPNKKWISYYDRECTATKSFDLSEIAKNNADYFETLLEEIYDDEVVHLYNPPKFTPKIMNILFLIHNVNEIKIAIYMQKLTKEVVFNEFCNSIKDRCSKINTPEQYRSMVQCSMVYYSLSEEEVEYCWSWLNSIDLDHMLRNTEILTLSHLQTFREETKNQTPPDENLIDVSTKRIDLGGDGDCFWRVLGLAVQEAKITKTMYDLLKKKLPAEWVEVNDYIDIMTQNKHHASALITVDNHTQVIGNSRIEPFIHLTISGDGNQAKSQDRGHYTYIAPSREKETYNYLQTTSFEAKGGASIDNATSEMGKLQDLSNSSRCIEGQDGSETGPKQRKFSGLDLRDRCSVLQQLQDIESSFRVRFTDQSVPTSINHSCLDNSRSEEHSSENGRTNRQPSVCSTQIGSQIQVVPVGSEAICIASFQSDDLLNWIWRQYGRRHCNTRTVHFMCGCYWSRERYHKLWQSLCNHHRKLVKSWSTKLNSNYQISGDAEGWLCSWNLVQINGTNYIRPDLAYVQPDRHLLGIRQNERRISNVRNNNNTTWQNPSKITRSQRNDIHASKNNTNSKLGRHKHNLQSTSVGSRKWKMGEQDCAGTLRDDRNQQRGLPRSSFNKNSKRTIGGERRQRDSQDDRPKPKESRKLRTTEMQSERQRHKRLEQNLKDDRIYSKLFRRDQNRYKQDFGKHEQNRRQQSTSTRNRGQYDCFSIGNLRFIRGRLNVRRRGRTIAHCVGADFTLGAGFAKQINKTYPHMKELFEEDLPFTIGTIVRYNDFKTGNSILNLVTKPYSNKKPLTSKTLNDCLSCLHEIDDVEEIDMPLIGVGLDALNEDDVIESLVKNSKKHKINIYINNNTVFERINKNWKK